MAGYISRTNEFAKQLIEKDLISSKKHNAIYDYFFQTTLRDAPWYEWPRAEYSMLCACEYESESQSQSLTHAQPTSDAPNK